MTTSAPGSQGDSMRARHASVASPRRCHDGTTDSRFGANRRTSRGDTPQPWRDQDVGLVHPTRMSRQPFADGGWTQVGHTGPLRPSETRRPIPYIDRCRTGLLVRHMPRTAGSSAGRWVGRPRATAPCVSRRNRRSRRVGAARELLASACPGRPPRAPEPVGILIDPSGYFLVGNQRSFPGRVPRGKDPDLDRSAVHRRDRDLDRQLFGRNPPSGPALQRLEDVLR